MAGFDTDILLIGGGVMSVTLASLIQQLDSSRSITLVEQGQQLAGESSDDILAGADATRLSEQDFRTQCE